MSSTFKLSKYCEVYDVDGIQIIWRSEKELEQWVVGKEISLTQRCNTLPGDPPEIVRIDILKSSVGSPLSSVTQQLNNLGL